MQRYDKDLNSAIGLSIFFQNNYQNIAFQRIKNTKKYKSEESKDLGINIMQGSF